MGDDPLAARRLRRKSAAAGRESGARERCQPAGGDQPGAADLREFRRARAEPARGAQVHGDRAARRRGRAVRLPRRPGRGAACICRQRGRPEHRHDPPARAVSERGCRALARAVREREPASVRAERGAARARAGGADRARGAICLRDRRGHARGGAQDQGRAPRRRARGGGERPRQGRARGDARPASPRAEDPRADRQAGGGRVVNICEIFIRRPVMTMLFMAGILIFGIAAYRLLPVSTLPNVDFPTIQVTADLPGASPETMASAVATVLERRFSTISGIDEMTSVSGQGVTRITIQFALDRDIDAAAQDVSSAIATAARQLPATMPSPPSFRKVNPADFPVYYLALTSDTLPLSTVNEYAETYLAQRISTISGVAQVQVFGQQKYAVRVQVDPNALAARGVGINEVEQAVAQANVNLPTGTLYGKDRIFAVQATGQLHNAEAFRPIIVTYRGGAPVRLKELGRVIDGVENDKVAAWFKDKRGIVLAIFRQPGTNTVEVVDRIKELLPTFRAEVPPAVSIEVLFDRSVTIRSSVEEVERTLYVALVLVLLVIFLFLRNIPATIIPSVALPMSIIGTFSVMYLFGYSLDNISLMALTLCVGFVVDDAIVMLENITRHLEQGKSVMQATLDGSKEIVFTIISMTLSLAAGFIPVLFMPGILGRLLNEFAVTLLSPL